MKLFFQITLTTLVLSFAFWVGYAQYQRSISSPWTRDGQVQANVVTVSSRVTGPVVDVNVIDNQYIKKGELLYAIEDSIFLAEVEQTKGQLLVDKANAAEALDMFKRAQKLVEEDKDALSRQALLQYQYKWQAAVAKVQESQAALKEAELNLTFTKIYAPVSGYITNYSLYKGTTSTEGIPLLSIVEEASYWIFGYFKETDIANIKVGDRAKIILMTYPDTIIEGVVHSLGWGIAQDNTRLNKNLLPVVSPTFEWIRLAQRIPVRIQLTKIPDNIRLRVGGTATVQIDTFKAISDISHEGYSPPD